MLPFYALHSLLVLSSHCNTAVFQHTNNTDCGGSSLSHCAANHPGVTACQGTVSLQPQLHSPPDFAMPASLINSRLTDVAVYMYAFASMYASVHEAFVFLQSTRTKVSFTIATHRKIRMCVYIGEYRFSGQRIMGLN